MLKNQKIAIIGAGNIAEALVSGLLDGQVVQASQIFATDVMDERLRHFETRYGVRVGSNNVEAVKGATVVILCVKPQVLDQVLAELKFSGRTQPLVISVAAGIPIARIQAGLKWRASIIRVMPNTPSIVSVSYTHLTLPTILLV